MHSNSTLSSAKSLLNRALVVQSYFPELKIHGHSMCEDVQYMRESLGVLKAHEGCSMVLDCGEGGTTFRFSALRASRKKGSHCLKVSARLLERPQKVLLSLLKQLGVQAELRDHELWLESSGWQAPKGILELDMSQSSQFASSLLLNSWLLDFDLEIQTSEKICSKGYWEMTCKMLQKMGMNMEMERLEEKALGMQKGGSRWILRAGQHLQVPEWYCEVDMSNVFALVVGAIFGGNSLHLADISKQSFRESLQPDACFVNALETMGIAFCLDERGFYLPSKNPQSLNLKPLEMNLRDSPDLFPLLALLCSLASGKSRLYGAYHLAYKESHRIHKVHELLNLLDVKNEIKKDGLIIEGRKGTFPKKTFAFNPDKDHRLAMACGVLMEAGHSIELQDPHCVNKSFPDFWKQLKEY